MYYVPRPKLAGNFDVSEWSFSIWDAEGWLDSDRIAHHNGILRNQCTGARMYTDSMGEYSREDVTIARERPILGMQSVIEPAPEWVSQKDAVKARMLRRLGVTS